MDDEYLDSSKRDYANNVCKEYYEEGYPCGPQTQDPWWPGLVLLCMGVGV